MLCLGFVIWGLGGTNGRAARWSTTSWQRSSPSTPDLYSNTPAQSRSHAEDGPVWFMRAQTSLYQRTHWRFAAVSRCFFGDSDWCSSSCVSFKLSASPNNVRRNPSGMTARVHHRSRCTQSSVDGVFPGQWTALPPRGKILVFAVVSLSCRGQFEFRWCASLPCWKVCAASDPHTSLNYSRYLKTFIRSGLF